MCQRTDCHNCRFRVKREVVQLNSAIPLPAPTSQIRHDPPPPGAQWLCQKALEGMQPNVNCVHPDLGDTNCPIATGKRD